ncbi:hypothetical protein LUZ60_017107 [Juncus effusus]|nr:hypothetical protein LUZ60_017107 [Juncus effusus]
MRYSLCKRGCITVRSSLQRLRHGFNCGAKFSGGFHGFARRYSTHFLLQDIEIDTENHKTIQKNNEKPISLAKSLAILSDESLKEKKSKKPFSRAEHKRFLELQIKKRVKNQFINGKFINLMDNVIANKDTLSDAYDIIRLDSNLDLESEKEYSDFGSLSEQLKDGNFNFEENIVKLNKRNENLNLPRLNLKIVQEAIRVCLEVIFRPNFSKISHGCRAGKGHKSALKFISKEIGVPNWYFTIHLNKEADEKILSKTISQIEEKIEDSKLVLFINQNFEAKVLNLVFGNFPKGYGLPQEGSLSPILMNIYLDLFDRDVFRVCMKYEALNLERNNNLNECDNNGTSNLRKWFRNQIKAKNENENEKENENGKIISNPNLETKLYACRFMDEIFIAIFGSKEIAENIKFELINFLNTSLYLDLNDELNLIAANNNNNLEIQFVGTLVRVAPKDSNKIRVVHKLKEKVSLFASQKKEIFDNMNLRIGKKWLAYGLKRVKESEIKSLNLSTPLLDKISEFRKDGMKTDHWYKTLLKVWLENIINAKNESNEEVLLAKYISEPALPKDLRDSFYNFQNEAIKYINSEEASCVALLNNYDNDNNGEEKYVVKIEAPLNFIKKNLNRYGLVNLEGFSKHVQTLILQDDDLIISWFLGLIHRWNKWYSNLDNFEEIRVLITENVCKSCIRTLAAKHKTHETIIEKKFELDLDFGTCTGTSSAELLPIQDEMYGISYSGLCVLTLSSVRVPTRVSLKCFVFGCTCGVESISIYTINVREKQRFPGFKTGFYPSIHMSLNGRKIGLCKKHVKDLYLGFVSLQSIEFGGFNR